MKPEEREFKFVEIRSCLSELEELARTYLNAARHLDKMLKPLEEAIRRNLQQGVPFTSILRKIEQSKELEGSGLTIRYDAFRGYCYRHFRDVIEAVRQRDLGSRGNGSKGERRRISESLQQRRRTMAENRDI